MYKKTQISLIEVTPTSISVEWSIDSRVNLTQILLKYQRTGSYGTDAGTLKISYKAIGYDLLSLSPDSLYEIQVAPCDPNRKYSWSNLLVVKTPKPKKFELFYDSEKIVKQVPVDTSEIIRARKLKDWDQYLYCGYKFARPKEIRATIVQRTLQYIESLDRLDQDFDTKDNLFQGPFVVSHKRSPQ